MLSLPSGRPSRIITIKSGVLIGNCCGDGPIQKWHFESDRFSDQRTSALVRERGGIVGGPRQFARPSGLAREGGRLKAAFRHEI